MTIEERIQQNNVVAYALCGFAVAFIVIAVIFGAVFGPLSDWYNEGLTIWLLRGISFVFLFSELLTVRNQTRKSLATLPTKLEDKIMHYRSLMIIRMALLEAVVVACSVLYLMTNDYIILIPGVISIGALFYYFPTRYRIRTELQLTALEL